MSNVDESIDGSKPFQTPWVYIIDFNQEVENKLKALSINYSSGTLGFAIDVDNKRYEQKHLLTNHNLPPHLHEFDIVMVDLTTKKTIEYDPDDHLYININGSSVNALLSEYPEQVFDPRPLAVAYLSNSINELLQKKSLIIAFCGENISAEYQFVKITNAGPGVIDRDRLSYFDIYKGFPESKTRNGRKASLPKEKSKLEPLLSKHLDDLIYQSVFTHPKTYIEGKYLNSPNFVPLLLNKNAEIISFLQSHKDATVLVFPNIKDKPNFISELFKTYLPEMIPDLFPYHGEFRWLENGDYPLPGEALLLNRRHSLKTKFDKDILDNEEALKQLKIDFKFLSDLISETGEALVVAVAKYFMWLEFDSVLNLDETNPELLEEDLQVDCGDKLLVVEVKGIGGTSTDRQCSQISKVKFRRAEERGRFDVYGLYIVNNERYLPPDLRSNPPFTQNQIRDANLEKRGLLTTYDLFKAYYEIEAGILTKENVRNSLFQYGLIKFKPEGLIAIGKPIELFQKGMVGIVNVENVQISVGDTLLVKTKGEYSEALVESLMLNGEEVMTCSNGQVGIKFNVIVKKSSEIFIQIT